MKTIVSAPNAGIAGSRGTSMPSAMRSRGRLLLSALCGVLFTLFWCAIVAHLGFYLNNSLIGYPDVNKLRIIIIAIIFTVCSYWSVVGVMWLVEDVSDWFKGHLRASAITRRASRRSQG